MTHSVEKLASDFKNFSDLARKGLSPLYETLSTQIADDPEILQLATQTRPEQLPPLILFGAVQYLLLEQDNSHPLADFYPKLTKLNLVRSPQDAYPVFREFCLEHKDDIQDLVATQRVQTNEARRCAVMLPAFAQIAEMTRQALVTVEIGTSAGLNLNWDRYRYHYSGASNMVIGSEDASLNMYTELRGEYFPAFPQTFPKIIERKGIDLNPLDPTDDNVTRWLHALIWAEHIDRAERLEAALKIVQEYPPEVIVGDALALLPKILPTMSSDGTLCIFHSLTIVQFSDEMRDQLDHILREHSNQRPIYRVWYEWEDEGGVLRLISYDKGNIENKVLANADAHGNWLLWHGAR